jgi:uncharacterized membrane protein
MSDLIVITFASEDDGAAALARVRDLQAGGAVHIDDSAVITKDANGKAHVHNQVDTGTKGGAIVGGFLGLFIGLFFLPVLGLAIGVAIGGLIGKSLGMGVDKKFIHEVTSELTPGTSALFVLLTGNSGALTEAMGPFKGKVFQTSLDPELENALNDALKTGV